MCSDQEKLLFLIYEFINVKKKKHFLKKFLDLLLQLPGCEVSPAAAPDTASLLWKGHQCMEQVYTEAESEFLSMCREMEEVKDLNYAFFIFFFLISVFKMQTSCE